PYAERDQRQVGLAQRVERRLDATRELDDDRERDGGNHEADGPGEPAGPARGHLGRGGRRLQSFTPEGFARLAALPEGSPSRSPPKPTGLAAGRPRLVE